MPPFGSADWPERFCWFIDVCSWCAQRHQLRFHEGLLTPCLTFIPPFLFIVPGLAASRRRLAKAASEGRRRGETLRQVFHSPSRQPHCLLPDYKGVLHQLQPLPRPERPAIRVEGRRLVPWLPMTPILPIKQSAPARSIVTPHVACARIHSAGAATSIKKMRSAELHAWDSLSLVARPEVLRRACCWVRIPSG